MPDKPFHIVFALYPGVTHLDFTGPHQFLQRLPNAKVTVASMEGGEMEADGLTFAGLTPYFDIERCDLICVPGGFGTEQAMGDEAFLAQVRRLAGTATYVTSVCTGSLILGAAGLLSGKRAACHWAWRDLLSEFGAIPDPLRVARDGNVITGGGVTAGIDFALVVAAEVAGEAFARGLQLGLEYAPSPPFEGGRPELTPAPILANVRGLYEARIEGQRAAAKAAAARLGSAVIPAGA